MVWGGGKSRTHPRNLQSCSNGRCQYIKMWFFTLDNNFCLKVVNKSHLKFTITNNGLLDSFIQKIWGCFLKISKTQQFLSVDFHWNSQIGKNTNFCWVWWGSCHWNNLFVGYLIYFHAQMKSQIDGGIIIIICIQPCVVGLTEHKSNLMYEFVHAISVVENVAFLFLSSSTNSVITFSIIN